MSSNVVTNRPGSAAVPEEPTQVFLTGGDSAAAYHFPADLPLNDLMALLRSDQRRHFSEGRPFPIEQVRAILDKSGATVFDWLALIVSELQLRYEFGPVPEFDEYARRFPELSRMLPAAFARAACHDSDAPTEKEIHAADSFFTLFRPASSGQTIPFHVRCETATPSLSADVVIPGYEILGVLGRGGMGVVYKARQIAANRTVALKMLLAGSQADEEDLARFRQEAEAVAALKHANIVEVHEIGEHEGKPYFSMEYISGGNLAKKIAGQPQSPAFAAEIAEKVARAMHAAHQQHIIHRDLKPANVLLAEAADSTSGRNGKWETDQPPGTGGSTLKGHGSLASQAELRPKITDFGLAKRLGGVTQLTVSGLVAGTPQYMAPEQIAPGAQAKVGPATDIYSIGVILYEMLTGRPPFVGSSPAEVMHQVLRHEPVAIRSLQPTIPRDLETICLKCLQKEPQKRYATALNLADDLSKYRAGEAILGRPIGKREQLMRWCWRNPAVSLLMLLTALTLALGAAISLAFALDAAAQARRAEDKEQEARRQEASAKRTADELLQEKLALERVRNELSSINGDLNDALKQVSLAREQETRLTKEASEREAFRARELYDANMILAQRAWETGQVARTRRLLSSYEPARHDQTDYRGFEWHYLSRICNSDGVRFNVPEGCLSFDISPDGQQIIWALRTGCEIWNLTNPPTRVGALGDNPEEGHRGTVERVAFDHTGKRIATAARDKTVKLWESKTRHLLHTIATGENPPLALRFAPDGKHVAVATGSKGRPTLAGELSVWDTTTAEKSWSLTGHAGTIYDLAYTPDGKQIASAGYDECVKVWDALNGDAVVTLPLPKNTSARSVAFAVRQPWLAAGTSKGDIRIWDRTTWKEERRLQGHLNWIYGVAFSSDGASLASAGSDQLLKIWNVADGQERRTYRGHTQPLTDVVWLPGRAKVFSSSNDNSIKSWETNQDPEHSTIHCPISTVANFHLLPDPWEFAVAGVGGFLGVWNSRDGRPQNMADLRGKWKGNIANSALSANGQSLAFILANPNDDVSGSVYTWDLKSEQPVALDLIELAKGPRCLDLSPDRKALATGHSDATIQVHYLDQKRSPITWKLAGRTVNQVLFQPDVPQRLLVLGSDVPPRLYELPDLKIVRAFRGHSRQVRFAAFSTDGRLLATASNDQNVCVWNVQTGALLFRLEGHTGPVRSVAFSPDNQRLVTASDDFTLKLWDLKTGHETMTLRGHTREVTQTAFSADGRRILSAGLDWTMRVWDAGAPKDRELYRAAAAACRLEAFEIDGKCQIGETVKVHGTVANVSGKEWPVPPRRPGGSQHRSILRLIAEPIVDKVATKDQAIVLGRTDFLPETTLEKDFRQKFTFPITYRLPPGDYRLRLEHCWQGDEIIPISQKSLDVVVKPK